MTMPKRFFSGVAAAYTGLVGTVAFLDFALDGSLDHTTFYKFAAVPLVATVITAVAYKGYSAASDYFFNDGQRGANERS